MTGIEIFYPVLTHVFLVIALYVLLAIRKAKAVKAKLVNLREAAVDNRAWNREVVLVSNNIANQFETPILFYVICIVSFLAGTIDMVSVGLAWFFVALRYVHAYLHTGANFVPLRMKAFMASMVVLVVMLVHLAVQMSFFS